MSYVAENLEADDISDSGVLNEEELLSERKLVRIFKSIKRHNGSFEAIRFLTEQMQKIDGVVTLLLDDRWYSAVTYNPETKAAFLFIAGQDFKKRKCIERANGSPIDDTLFYLMRFVFFFVLPRK